MGAQVVIDTNIFISALLRESSYPRKVIQHCLEGTLQPLMGATLFCEYESALSRSAIFKRCALSTIERDELFNAFLYVCQWIPVYYLWRPNLRDEADNHLIELAVAGNARAIITGNIKDLRKGELLFPDIRIISATEFLKEKYLWQH